MGGRLYRETGHQARFASALGLPALGERYRSPAHLITTLQWLTDEKLVAAVYPSG